MREHKSVAEFDPHTNCLDIVLHTIGGGLIRPFKEVKQDIYSALTIGLVRVVGALLKQHPKFKTEDGKFKIAVGFLNTLDLHSVVEILISKKKNSVKEVHTAYRDKLKQRLLH